VLKTAAAAECPPLPSLPEISDEDRERQAAWKGVAAPYSIVHWAGGHDYAPFGVGHLRIEKELALYYDWQKAVSLPVWRAPGGSLYAWVYAGAVHPLDGSAVYPLTGMGMVETDYEHQTFIVFESTDDGWFKIRLRPGEGGDVWTHECHLGLGEDELSYQPWERLIEENGEWLHFRARVPHALRSAPQVHSRRITWIGLNHELRLLERKGDWLRVRVRQPAWACVGPDQEFKGRIDEGWVKWRDEISGPWVWYYTRGC